MTRRTYGLLAGLTGSLVGLWWWRRRAANAELGQLDRGVVIYRNTPIYEADVLS